MWCTSSSGVQNALTKQDAILFSHSAAPYKQESKGHQQIPWFLNVMPEPNGNAVCSQWLLTLSILHSALIKWYNTSKDTYKNIQEINFPPNITTINSNKITLLKMLSLKYFCVYIKFSFTEWRGAPTLECVNSTKLQEQAINLISQNFQTSGFHQSFHVFYIWCLIGLLLALVAITGSFWKGLHFWPSALMSDEVISNISVAMYESWCPKKSTNTVLCNKCVNAFNSDSKWNQVTDFTYSRQSCLIICIFLSL